MRNSLLILLWALVGLLFVSCNRDDDDNPDDANTPDTTFEISVTGDQTNSFHITIPSGEPQTDFSIAGGFSDASNLLTMSFGQVPIGWRMNIVVVANDLNTGTYQSDINMGAVSSYTSTSQPGFNFLGDNFTVEITKSDLFANTTASNVYFVDGNFSGTLPSPNPGEGSVSVSGSFAGVPVGAN